MKNSWIYAGLYAAAAFAGACASGAETSTTAGTFGGTGFAGTPATAGTAVAGAMAGTPMAGTPTAGTVPVGGAATAGTIAGTTAGTVAGTQAGTTAGTVAGTTAGTQAGTTAGTVAGTTAGTAAGMTAAGTGSTDPMAMCMQRGVSMGEDPACTQCVCSMCLDEAAEVFDNADPTFAQNAQAVVTCVRGACCTGSDCYCGDGSVDNLLVCLPPLGPMGPCMSQIEAASGITPGDAIMAQTACDPAMGTTACAAAQRFGACVLGDATTTGKCPMCDTCN